MASQHERWLGHISLNLHALNDRSDFLSLESAMETIVAQNIVGTPDASFIDQRWVVQLAEIDLSSHPGFVCLLFLGIDKDRGEAVYGDITTLNLRTANKLPNEGGAVAAHLLINLTPLDGLNANSAVLEEVDGLSRSRIVPYLRWLIAKYVAYDGVNAEGEVVDILPNLSCEVILDKPISEQFTQAKLLAVDVFKKAKSSTIDTRLAFYEKTRRIEYRPTTPVKGAPALDIVRKILAINPSSEYPEVRVRLEEGSGAERSVGVNREKGDTLMAAFQLRTLVSNLNPPMEEATRAMATHLLAEMKRFCKQ